MIIGKLKTLGDNVQLRLDQEIVERNIKRNIIDQALQLVHFEKLNVKEIRFGTTQSIILSHLTNVEKRIEKLIVQ